eukprot:CAMPEP_0118948340 /NCGR_PEP_ID=MMETSP1169-20130426/47647_1 /TAXON_ID=36882 /ORGANISM="Pyramimonas obovata, Strain CCMP722" /LENGTH=92 /DNA_ID=CAMNT_0006894741 /DNA_START=100 /DNA_END=375 /DNA_ORIENTATION=-
MEEELTAKLHRRVAELVQQAKCDPNVTLRKVFDILSAEGLGPTNFEEVGSKTLGKFKRWKAFVKEELGNTKKGIKEQKYSAAIGDTRKAELA